MFWIRLAGVSGLAVILLFVNVLVSRLLMGSHVISSAALIVALFVIPFFQADDAADSSVVQSIRAGIAQPGWSAERWADVDDTSKPRRFIEESQAVATRRDGPELDVPEPDVVVFPETSLPIGNEARLRTWANELADSLKTEVMIGGILEEPTPTGLSHFNVSVMSHTDQALYRKRRLVPFAEKVPLSHWIPFFNHFSIPAGGITAYSSGSERSLFTVSGMQAGVLICFESMFFRDALRYRRDGANLIIVQTQDGWWTSDRPRIQHFAFSRLLASAIGLPLIHASVDGVSGFVDQSGNVLAQSEPDTQAFLVADLPVRARQTFYVQFGEWSLLIIIASAVGILLSQGLIPELNFSKKRVP